MKTKSAKGASGHLLYGPNGYFFRVYNKDKDYSFTDYDLRHCDLCVTITDDDATFYTDENGSKLDHNPATLGVYNE